ncbi:MAG: rod shape-determining protein MreC [Elusimicrobiota bacterium]|nr:rod shape-determining protein MreC [Endomicrobiia bacterium]MDW8165480.1 rod shape-determining protein MreC [Elusimicrobiota bacterium]
MSFKIFLYKNRPTVLFLSLLILSIISILTSKFTTPYFSNLRSFFIYFFNFTYKPIYQIVDYPLEIINKFIYIPYLYDENIKLKEKLKQKFVENLFYKQIIDEMYKKSQQEMASSLLNFYITNAKVIIREYNSWYNECIISIENSQNIKKDSPVIILGEDKRFYFVGRIWDISNSLAKVLLITNPLSKIPVKVRNKPIYGVIVGNSSPEVTMEYILLEDDIRIGDVIETFELNGLIGGIEIGRVVSIETMFTLGFKKAKVKLNFNINMLKELVVVTPL